MNKEKLKQLWARINDKVKAGELRPLSGVDSEEKFLRLMSTPSNRKKFWQATHTEYYKAGINLGELEDFEAVYGGPSQSTLTKYVGTYDGEGALFPSFEIIEKEGKLYMKKGGLEVVLEKISENKFKGKFLEEFEITFTVTGDSATGGNIVVSNKTINFTKSLLGSSLSTINWLEVANSTWDALKKAGYWVKEEGGKLLAAIRNGLHVKKEEVNPFECIDNWNKRWGYYKLLRGDDGKTEFAFEVTDYQVDGKATKFIYYPDYRFVVKFDKTDKDVQGGKGRWACSKDGQGYQLVWDDGRKATFSRLKGQPDGEFSTVEGGQTSQENEVTKFPTFSESCKAIKSCPSVQDVLEKGRAFKLCMKCPEIERLQKIPSLNFLYSQILAENGKKIKTDQYFGPILQAAVKRYQIGLFGKSTGMIGPKTYQSLMKDETSVEDKKVETSQVKIDEPKAGETNLEIVTSQTQL